MGVEPESFHLIKTNLTFFAVPIGSVLLYHASSKFNLAFCRFILHFQSWETIFNLYNIKEQKFQYSGCVTDACMVEIGKMIGVNQIVGGSISKVGNVYSVSARIINVETGEIENTGVYDHTGDIGGLLTEGMMRVAIELIK